MAAPLGDLLDVLAPYEVRSLLGGEVQWAMLEGGVAEPALAIRGHYSKLLGVAEPTVSDQRFCALHVALEALVHPEHERPTGRLSGCDDVFGGQGAEREDHHSRCAQPFHAQGEGRIAARVLGHRP